MSENLQAMIFDRLLVLSAVDYDTNFVTRIFGCNCSIEK
jgi:hypothetical protein